MTGKSFSSATIFPQFRELLEKASKHVREVISFVGDIRYGEKGNQTIDVFGTDSLPTDSPIFVFIHGGKWQYLDKTISCHMVTPLIKSNVRPIIADFDSALTVTLEEMIEEIKRLANFIFDYALKHNVRSVVFCGHSSGAHLISCLLDRLWIGKLSDAAKAVFTGLILISGVYDVTHVLTNENNLVLKLNRERAEKCSCPALHDEGLLPLENFNILIAVGGQDNELFLKQASLLNQSLRESGAKVEYQVLPEYNHFDINLNLMDADFILLQKIISMAKSR